MPLTLALSSCQPYDRLFLQPALADAGHVSRCLQTLASPAELDALAGCDVLVSFVGDRLDAAMLRGLAARGVRLVVQRAAGIDNIDLDAARAFGLRVARVPAYSPASVAEHATALLLALVRHLPRALEATRGGNFSLDGLLGFSLSGKTVGIVGMGRIGQTFARIMRGFDCRVVAVSRSGFSVDGVIGVDHARLWREADIVSLHCPLTPATHHLVDVRCLAQAKPGLVLINTARGAIVDTGAVLAALDDGRLGAYGADVYENEACVFFRDVSACGYDDPLLARLIAHPCALITPHQAFFTRDALAEIATSVRASVDAFVRGETTPAFVI